MKKIITGIAIGAMVLLFSVPMQTSAFDLVIGNTAVSRPVVDSYNNFSIVDTNNPANFDGAIYQFDYWASNTNPFKFLIVDASKVIQWKSDLITPSTVGAVNTYIPTTPPDVEIGWNVGLYFQGTGTIPFAYDSFADAAYYEPNNAGEPAIGETLSTAGTTRRYYSFVANGWIADDDNDGIADNNDLCLGTDPDDQFTLGTNRWEWNGTEWHYWKPKTGGYGTSEWATMEYTYGCSCEQILDSIAETTDLSFEGHYKYGCSKSILEDWHRGTYYIGPTFVETVTVPANSSTPTSSVATLDIGKDYFLNVSGTWTNSLNVADAEYASINGWVTSMDGYNINPWFLGTGEFDLQVNNSFVNWGAYNPAHTYSYPFSGNGALVNFRVFDGDSNTSTLIPSWYGDNSGNLSVDIFEDKWVDLW